jgi:lipopolysaccharide export system protein LptA
MKTSIVLIFFSLIFISSFAQVPPSSVTKPDTLPAGTTKKDSLKVVEILSADRYSFKKLDSINELLLLVGNVALKQGNTKFYADSAVYNKNGRIVEAFRNVHINDNDSIDIYSDYLLYYMDPKIAILKKNVRLTDGKSNLYTKELEYHVNEKVGIYRNGGRVVNGTSVLTSEEGTYYSDIKDMYFYNNVKLVDPKYKLESDSLLYNTNTEITTFISETLIEDSAKRTILTSEGFYDLKNRIASFGKRPIIKDGPSTTIANQVDTDDNTGISVLTGNAVFKDTAQGIAILANSIITNKNTGALLATQKPLMIIKQENDSTFITADTLYSGRLSELADSLRNDSVQKKIATNKNDSADRFFRAYYNVRIYSDSMQAVCDSLFYSGVDSVFRMFRDPVIWASNSQVNGDTIYLYTKNRKPLQLYVFESGMMINKTGEDLFNQIRGNRLYGYFIEGEINNVRAKGNAESIYYAKDSEDKLIGINKATSDIIDMRFKNKELNKVVFISEVNGTMYPVNQIPEDETRLRNFKWQEERRPKSKFELFGN